MACWAGDLPKSICPSWTFKTAVDGGANRGMAAMASVVRDTFPVQATLPYRTYTQQARIGGDPSISRIGLSLCWLRSPWGSRSREQWAVIHPVPPLFRDVFAAQSHVQTFGQVMSLGQDGSFDEFVFDHALGVVGLDSEGAGGSFLLPLRSFGSRSR